MTEKKNSKNILQEIKIQIDPELITTPNANENVRWEDDGGQLPNVIQMIDNSLLPLKPGDSFKVLKGHLTQENGHVYYVAELEYLTK
jgi:hypothetical protein